MAFQLRIKRDINNLVKEQPKGIRLATELLDESDLKEIFIDIQVYENPLYEGKTYRLRIRFSNMYPIDVPWVQFVNPRAGLIQDQNLIDSIRAKQNSIKLREQRKLQQQEQSKSGGSKLNSSSKFHLFQRSKPSSETIQQPPPPVVKSGTSVEDAVALDGIPVHPHVYGNGHICLDMLGTGWSPAHSVTSIAISLQSMLSGNDIYEFPPDNNNYVSHAPLNPKESLWDYHDDSV